MRSGPDIQAYGRGVQRSFFPVQALHVGHERVVVDDGVTYALFLKA